MKNSIRFIALIAVVAASAATAAIPEVSGVTMAQPGTRKVTIEYTLTGGPAVVTFAVQTNANVNAAADDPGWTSIGGEAVCNAKGDVWKLVTGDGAHTITWRPDETWPDHVIPAGGARAVVTVWSPENPPPYMVVDISAGAQPNTQRYDPAVEFLPGGILGNPDYRLAELPPERLAEFVTNGGWQGLNVTIPYKKAVLPLCSSLSARAQKIGAVNLILRKANKLIGDNTDYYGFEQSHKCGSVFEIVG